MKVSKGFSLPELMITAVIGLVVILGAVSLMNFAISHFFLLVEKNDVEEGLMRASYFSRIFLSQAVDIYAVPAGGPVPFDATHGSVVGRSDNGGVIYDSETLPADGARDNLALFVREAGDVTTGSQMKLTGMFFDRPKTTDAASGTLFFAINSTVAGGVATLPIRKDLFFDRVSRITLSVISTGNVPGPFFAKEALLKITVRSHRTLNRGKWRFCRPTQAGCTLTEPYGERSMDVRIGFRNNALGNSLLGNSSQIEYLHGGLYYFRFINPQMQF